MHYYLKILKKNDAGWLQLSSIDYETNLPVHLLPEPTVGYHPIPGPNIGSPYYGHLALPNLNEPNLVLFQMTHFPMDSNPPRLYQWHVKFQIIAVPNIGIFGTANGEIAVTDIIEENGTWYGDPMGLSLMIAHTFTPNQSIEKNRERYNEWKVNRQ